MEPGNNKMLGKRARDSNEPEKVAMGVGKVEEGRNANDSQSKREVLRHWALELYDDYGISPHTFYRALMFVDRFLITNVKSLSKYKLLFVSALFIASKYEEFSPLSLRDCSTLSGHLTDKFCSVEEILKMELKILSSPDFELGSPSILTFLEAFINSSQKDDRYSVEGQVESLTYSVAELSFLDHRLTGFPPSIVAASALFLARLMIRPDIHPWSSVMEQETNCKPSDLKDCIQVLHGKYKTCPHLGEARLVPPEEIPASYFEE